MNPEFHNATLSWLLIGTSIFLIMVSGGLAFTGRGQNAGSTRRPFLDRVDPEFMPFIVIFGGFFGIVLVFFIIGGVYNLANREIDIQAAKAGISSPTTRLPLSRRRFGWYFGPIRRDRSGIPSLSLFDRFMVN